MLNEYLLTIANTLDKKGRHEEADAIDQIRIAQVMPNSGGALYDVGHNATQEVQKIATQQTSMLKNIDADLAELKNMKANVTRGARDFWRFRRSKYQQPAQQAQPATNMAQFGLRGVPAPQMRNSETTTRRFAQVAGQPVAPTAPAPRANPQVQSPAPMEDEVDAFFEWLQAEQAKKLQNGNNGILGGNMNLPFSIG